MLQYGDVIKHTRNKDVAYFIIGESKEGHIARIITMGFNNSFFNGEFCTITDELINSGEWLICLEPEKECIRESQWKKI